MTTHRPTCPQRQSDLCQGAKRKTSKTALRRLLQRTDRANQWSFVRASHVPFDAEVGATYTPIAHRLARGGGFHLCELASTATRVGLSNLSEFDFTTTDIGRSHRGSFANFRFVQRTCTPPQVNELPSLPSRVAGLYSCRFGQEFRPLRLATSDETTKVACGC